MSANQTPAGNRERVRPGVPARACATGRRQRGVALIIGLVILVVLALLGASAYSVATQDERIAGNARDRSRAMDAAETALRECEHFIEQNGSPAFNGQNRGMLAAPANGGMWVGDTKDWTTLPASSVYPLPPAKLVNPEWTGGVPACVAEAYALSNKDRGIAPAGLPQQQQPSMQVARVTARGYGLNSNTQVNLVSYVAFY